MFYKLHAIVLHDEESLGEWIKPIEYLNGIYVTKIRLSLLQWKSWIKSFMEKGSSRQKGVWTIQKDWCVGQISLNRKFDTFYSNWEKSFFKKSTFNRRPIPGRFFFLK